MNVLVFAILNVVHSDCWGGVVQDACIGVGAGEGMKAEEVPSHGIGHGQSMAGTPDKVHHYACLHVIGACGLADLHSLSHFRLWN